MTNNLCTHGALARSCDWCQEVAELSALIATLRAALTVTAGNILSLGPAGALGPTESYREWLAVVDHALAQAEGR